MITQRSYKTENDKLAMAALAGQFAQDHLRIIDLPYRLSSWALDDPRNACLWEAEDGSLVAWAVLQPPFWTLDYTLHQDYAGLFPELLVWADQRAEDALDTPYGLTSWYTNIFSDQTGRIRQLEQAGYVSQADLGEDSWSKVWMKRPGNIPVKDYRIPNGFTVRALAGESEVAAYVDLHQVVFGTKNMTVEWRSRTLQHPNYTSDLDVVVEAPGGRLAAFCIGWLRQMDDGRLLGQIEPLGCHADFRHYALGRIALAEVLRRLQAHNVADIYVETDVYRDTARQLYENMGFDVIRDVLIYRKDFT